MNEIIIALGVMAVFLLIIALILACDVVPKLSRITGEQLRLMAKSKADEQINELVGKYQHTIVAQRKQIKELERTAGK